MRPGNGIKNLSLRGSFTIEASVIVPISIFISATLILISFYMHDNSVFVSASLSALYENSQNLDNSDSVKSTIEGTLSSVVIMGKKINYSFTQNDDGGEITLNAGFDWKNPILTYFAGNSTSTSDVNVSVSNLSGRPSLLKEQALKSAASLISGDDKQ